MASRYSRHELAGTVNPDEASQRARDAGLVFQRTDPLNCETPVAELIGGVVMPNAHFYVRNHFEIPKLDPSAWRLEVGGLVQRPRTLSLQDIHRMGSQTVIATMECAGNGRVFLNPPTDGEQWGLGAVSIAEWIGVSLREVLETAGVLTEAREVLFRGADGGTVAARSGVTRFERSLSLDVARDPDILLAYAMNGEALPPEHGYPLRLVVPGWYGVASVKWLTEIEVIGSTFEGFFQAERYFFEWERSGQLVKEPVTLQRVRSLITDPAQDDEVAHGDLAVRGVAWSGTGPIARVDVSVDGGAWQPARLAGERHGYGWQRWELITRTPGAGLTTVRARATDIGGRTQPEQPEWNRLGYGSNAIQEVSIRVR
jgi:DMSO/TMAO reductase YedYZ molybdopterin-dependent catalytic subunit